MRSTLWPALESFYPHNHPNKPKWSPGTSEIIWPNGAKAICVSAESSSDSIRGLNTQLIIADECAFYGNNEDIVTMAYLTLRRPPSKMIALTSPHPTPLIIDWVNRAKNGDKNIRLITGTTYDNQDNLSDAFMDTIVNQFVGTSMERQELLGDLVLENPSALSLMATSADNSVFPNQVPRMEEVALGLDPSLLGRTLGSTKKSRTPDDAGLVVAGKGEDGYWYALDNFTGKFSVQGWVRKSIEIYDSWSVIAPMTIMIEKNNLGEELLQDLYQKEGRADVWRKVKTTFSTQNKMQRMQPYGLMAEQGKIKFVKKPSMEQLYTELTSYTGPVSGYSPGAFDAFAFAMLQLSPVKKSYTKSYDLLF